MSGSNNENADSGAPADGTEPSMEEILASIRRILKDDQSPQVDGETEEEMLVLDASMVVKSGTGFIAVEPFPDFETAQAMPIAEEPEPAATPGIYDAPQPHFSTDAFDLSPNGPSEEATDSLEFSTETAAENNAMEESNMSDNTQENVQSPDGLVSEAASNAAAGSIGALIRSISSDRQIAVGRPGLTLEDLVREELRPLLKSWLDSNLPALVERIVRAEIQRVIERSTI